jgi:hypothetical protein
VSHEFTDAELKDLALFGEIVAGMYTTGHDSFPAGFSAMGRILEDARSRGVDLGDGLSHLPPQVRSAQAITAGMDREDEAAGPRI